MERAAAWSCRDVNDEMMVKPTFPIAMFSIGSNGCVQE